MKRSIGYLAATSALVLASWGAAAPANAQGFTLKSTTFQDGQMMPKKVANKNPQNPNCVGDNVSPQLSWSGAPALPMAQRLVGNAMEGGMATRPCPAMITSDARHTDRCNRNVIIVSLQGHKHRAGALASNIVKFAGGRAARLPTALISVHSRGRIL